MKEKHVKKKKVFGLANNIKIYNKDKVMRMLALSLLVFVVSCNNFPKSNWKKIMETDKWDLYIDAKSITQIENAHIAWLFFDRRGKEELIGERKDGLVTVDKDLMIKMYDCNDEKVANVELRYISNEKTYSWWNFTREGLSWSDVGDNKVNRKSYEFVCRIAELNQP